MVNALSYLGEGVISSWTHWLEFTAETESIRHSDLSKIVDTGLLTFPEESREMTACKISES